MTEFILLSFLLSCLINGVYIVFNWDGMLLQLLGLTIEDYLPEWTCKMLFTCATCMSGIWGAATFLYFYDLGLELIGLQVLAIGTVHIIGSDEARKICKEMDELK